MQKIKFPDSIVSYISCQEEVYEQQVPHLMLYTIAENAFKYAMGYQMPLILFVQCEEEDRGGRFPDGTGMLPTSGL